MNLEYFIDLVWTSKSKKKETDLGYYIDLRYYIGLGFKTRKKYGLWILYRPGLQTRKKEGSWMLYVESIFKSFVSIWNILRCLSTSYWIYCCPELCY
ncbi:unnamed protein product [Rhizophagus irregularis]|uniref:Uncharacterized protein n=1 Tax=Rhizophagus irregularis TaxID=588596 RepID=A0A915YP71_9GLOM|nr:unnamed protein product [Rhizophagus irregularis]CAB5302007.1 unnamed protein product [Rhizophagus irregularis]